MRRRGQRKVGYKKRWAAEGAFSNLKRAFGELVSARKFENMKKEMTLKALCYNSVMNLSARSAQ